MASKPFKIAVASIAIVVLARCCGLTFEAQSLNVIAILFAFYGYAYFAFASFTIKPKGFGMIVGIVLSAPIIIGIVTLPLTALGLAFILTDVTSPSTVQEVRHGVVCRTQEYGMAASDDGLSVELTRPILGLLDFELYKTSISYSSPGVTYGTPCEYAFDQLAGSHH
jgi:hypothetical protein